MAGVGMKMSARDTASAAMREVVSRARQLHGLLTAAGQIVKRSVEMNFQAGGRPAKWAPRSEPYGRKMRAAGHNQVLVVSGDLKNSITADVNVDEVTVGSSLKYARPMQVGAKKGSFGTVTVARRLGKAGRSGASLFSRGWKMAVPWGDIPARPFLRLQEIDTQRLRKMAAEWITAGKK